MSKKSPDMKVIVASHNPVKIEAVRRGFARIFPDNEFVFEGISVPSGVSDQPMTDADTFHGAQNRARNAAVSLPGAVYYAGIEGGIESGEGGMAAFAWIVIRNAEGKEGKGRTGAFFLPPEVAKLVEGGMELGDADDVVFGKTNSKQQNGAVGLLTGNVLDRTGYYEQAVILAAIPFRNPELYG
jgi:inosine/xanthosine triphosphatase